MLQRGPAQVPSGSTATPPLTLRLDAVVTALAAHVSEEGAFLIRETELGPETLFSLVAKMTLSPDDDPERAYQRRKRVRSRAKKRLGEVIAAR